jgi:hypothetical protein
MTDSLPTPDDRAPSRPGDRPADPGAEKPDDDTQSHEEQPGFPEGPISPAEGGD